MLVIRYFLKQNFVIYIFMFKGVRSQNLSRNRKVDFYLKFKFFF